MNETLPYSENNERKAQTRGEAIFGDKHEQFNITPVGQEQLDHADNAAEKNNIAVNLMGELAARKLVSIDSYVNQHGDIPQDQLDKITTRMR